MENIEQTNTNLQNDTTTQAMTETLEELKKTIEEQNKEIVELKKLNLQLGLKFDSTNSQKKDSCELINEMFN